MTTKRISFHVGENEAGLRLDKALGMHKEVGTRSRAESLIDAGLVRTNGAISKKSSLVLKTGDLIIVDFPEPKPSDLQPLHMHLDIVFEDKDLLVVNKPSGLVVHPAAGHAQDTLVNALLAHTKDLSMKFGESRPGIVHRLDKETSGLLVVAKHDRAHEHLVRQFQDRRTHRIYEAAVIGKPMPEKNRISSFLARHPNDRKRYASVLGTDRKPLRDHRSPPPVGKWAATNYNLQRYAHGLSLLEIRLETGRTHQIRVHLSESGWPLVGDILYGADRRQKRLESGSLRSESADLDRFLLHAMELGFEHPATGEHLRFHQEWPEDALSFLRRWGLKE